MIPTPFVTDLYGLLADRSGATVPGELEAKPSFIRILYFYF